MYMYMYCIVQCMKLHMHVDVGAVSMLPGACWWQGMEGHVKIGPVPHAFC